MCLIYLTLSMPRTYFDSILTNVEDRVDIADSGRNFSNITMPYHNMCVHRYRNSPQTGPYLLLVWIHIALFSKLGVFFPFFRMNDKTPNLINWNNYFRRFKECISWISIHKNQLTTAKTSLSTLEKGRGKANALCTALKTHPIWHTIWKYRQNWIINYFMWLCNYTYIPVIYLYLISYLRNSSGSVESKRMNYQP